MRTETGQAVLAATSPVTAGSGPLLSALAGRVAVARGLTVPAPSTVGRPATACLPALVRPAAGLVTAPPADRRLSTAAVSAGVASLSVLGAHGGAGVSALLRCGLAEAGAVDAQRHWPSAGAVLLVARTSTSGLEWARDLARQHAAGAAGLDTRLVGLVLIADAPGRLPARVRDLADLVCGAFARHWRLPWLEEWRLAAASEPLPLHPAVVGLLDDLRRVDASVPFHSFRGDLL